MIRSTDMIFLLNTLAFIGTALCAPMGPPSDPVSTARMKTEEILDSGIQQGKLASEALHNQLLAVNDLQSKQLAAAGAQVAEISSTGVQQGQLLTNAVQNQLLSAFLQQQQLASASIQAQKLAADALNKQIQSSIDFQQKLISAGLQVPQMVMGAVQQPLASLQSLTGVQGLTSVQALAGQIPGMQLLASQIPGLQQQQGGMVPMIAGLDRLITVPFTLLSPFLTAAANAVASAPGITLSAG